MCNRSLASSLPQVTLLAGLEGLHLISLSKITNEGILPLKHLSKLKHIMLARCPNVCETGLPVGLPIL